MAASMKRTRRKFAQYTQYNSDRPQSLTKDKSEVSKLGSLPWANSLSALAFTGLVPKRSDPLVYSIESDISHSGYRGLSSHRHIGSRPQFSMQLVPKPAHQGTNSSVDRSDRAGSTNPACSKLLKQLWYELYHFNHTNPALKEAQDKTAAKYAYLEISDLLMVQDYEMFAEQTLNFCMEVFKKMAAKDLMNQATDSKRSETLGSPKACAPKTLPIPLASRTETASCSHRCIGAKHAKTETSFISKGQVLCENLNRSNTSLDEQPVHHGIQSFTRVAEHNRGWQKPSLRSQPVISLTSGDRVLGAQKENMSPDPVPLQKTPSPGYLTSRADTKRLASPSGDTAKIEQTTNQSQPKQDLLSFLQQFKSERQEKVAQRAGKTYSFAGGGSSTQTALHDHEERTFGCP